MGDQLASLHCHSGHQSTAGGCADPLLAAHAGIQPTIVPGSQHSSFRPSGDRRIGNELHGAVRTELASSRGVDTMRPQ